MAITRNIMKKYCINSIPEINGGDCFNWALEFYNKFGKSKSCKLYTVMAFGGHAFVLYKGMFYDAESPNAVNDWRNLDTWENWVYYDNMRRKRKYQLPPYDKAEKMTLKQFKKYWCI
jgi:hypothetical protein